MKNLALIILSVLCIAQATNSKTKITIAPEIGIMGGTTEYEMDIKGMYDYNNGGTLDTTIRRITSLLVFPLDVTIGGITAEIFPIEEPSRWSITTKILTNLNQPSSKMTDKDWDEILSKFSYMLWSDTESDAKMSMTILDVEARFRIAQRKNMDISIIAGGRYQKVDQDLVGVKGWQLPFNRSTSTYGNTITFDTLQTTTVGTYEIKLKQFKIGLQSDIYFSKNLTTQLKIAFAPASFEDVDDHILRKKLSKGSGDGNGIITGLNVRYSEINSKLSYIQLSGSYNKYTSNGSQVQEWYGDDLSSPDVDDTDNIIIGLPHTIRTKQYSISLRFGFEL